MNIETLLEVAKAAAAANLVLEEAKAEFCEEYIDEGCTDKELAEKMIKVRELAPTIDKRLLLEQIESECPALLPNFVKPPKVEYDTTAGKLTSICESALPQAPVLRQIVRRLTEDAIEQAELNGAPVRNGKVISVSVTIPEDEVLAAAEQIRIILIDQVETEYAEGEEEEGLDLTDV